MEEDQKVKIDPFKGIGLCFSGGGYRATFYSLGIVSYLNEVQFEDKPLLEEVQAMSSVSGGTLLAVAYAKMAQELKTDFKTFFKTFYDTFTPENDTLLETAINKLEDDTVWKANEHKTRSLINAFALVYAEMDVFKGDFSLFETPTSKHLKQVCFNATDFSFGLTYRFQNDGDFGSAPLDNAFVKALRPKIKLGDVIASSSCFPLGFEPLLFPDDYFKDQKDENYQKLKSLKRFENGVGIMDGGIADNQGIGSMMLINGRMKGALNLIIVNDVGSFKMKPWQQDDSYTKKGPSIKQFLAKALSYFKIKALYIILILIGLALIILNSMHVFNTCNECVLPVFYIIGSILMGIGLTLTFLGGLATIATKLVKAKIASLFRKNVPEVLLDDIITFKKLDIGLVQQMLTNRLTSTVKMVNDVFLKQLRRLNYDLFYSKSSLIHKRITTTVYKLNGQETAYSGGTPKYNEPIKPAPSSLLKDVCLTASETPTTLWWDKEDILKNRMDTLIACGQFTLCYELMEYIIELRNSKHDLDLDFDALDEVDNQLKKHWIAFNKDPFFLVKALKK